MTLLRAQVALPYRTGEPGDVIVNTWHFDTPDPIVSPGDWSDVTGALVTFYNVIDQYLADGLDESANAATVTLWQVNAGGPGPEDDTIGTPVYVQPFTLTLGVQPPLPHEVACCLSFSSSLAGIPEHSGGTRPASRRRGRVYLGPLDSVAWLEQDANGTSRPKATTRTAVLTAVTAMQNGLQALGRPKNHVIYSPTAGTYVIATNYWIDDAFDTMRGRGVQPTSRITQTA